MKENKFLKNDFLKSLNTSIEKNFNSDHPADLALSLLIEGMRGYIYYLKYMKFSKEEIVPTMEKVLEEIFKQDIIQDVLHEEM